VDAGSTSRVGGLVIGSMVRAAVTIGYTFLVSVRASRHQRCSQALRPVGFSIRLKIPATWVQRDSTRRSMPVSC